MAKKLLQGKEIAVPAAVMEGDEETFLLLGKVDETENGGGGGC